MLGDVGRAQRLAVLAGEHPARVLPRLAPLQPLEELALAPGLQHGGRTLVDLDDAVAVLALGGVQLVSGLGLADVQPAVREVEVCPFQVGQL